MTDELDQPLRKCPCGKGVSFWSALTGQGYCSEACYEKAKEEHNESMQQDAL